MSDTTLWHRAAQAQIQVAASVAGGLDIGFDRRIPADIQSELRRFTAWAESEFTFPISLWVDFEYKHYLVSRERKHVGYLFYWADWENYPVFTDPDSAPSIRLPVRTEKSGMEDILFSLVQAMTDYFAWLLNELDEAFFSSDQDVEAILQAYHHAVKHQINYQAK